MQNRFICIKRLHTCGFWETSNPSLYIPVVVVDLSRFIEMKVKKIDVLDVQNWRTLRSGSFTLSEKRHRSGKARQ